MDAVALITLFALAAINAAIPGPCIILAISRAADCGISAGLRVSFGMVLATLLLVGVSWSAMIGAVSLGTDAFDTMKLAGIVVVALIGLTMLHPGSRRGPSVTRGAWSRTGDVGTGVAVGLSSPIKLVFMIALLPQFVDLEGASPALAATIAGVVLVATALPMAAASALGAGSGRLVPARSRWMSRAGGIVLLGFVGLAAAS